MPDKITLQHHFIALRTSCLPLSSCPRFVLLVLHGLDVFFCYSELLQRHPRHHYCLCLHGYDTCGCWESIRTIVTFKLTQGNFCSLSLKEAVVQMDLAHCSKGWEEEEGTGWSRAGITAASQAIASIILSQLTQHDGRQKYSWFMLDAFKAFKFLKHSGFCYKWPHRIRNYFFPFSSSTCSVSAIIHLASFILTQLL